MSSPNDAPADPEAVIEGLVPDLNETPIHALKGMEDPLVLAATERLVNQVLKDQGSEITIRHPQDPSQLP